MHIDVMIEPEIVSFYDSLNSEKRHSKAKCKMHNEKRIVSRDASRRTKTDRLSSPALIGTTKRDTFDILCTQYLTFQKFTSDRV